MSKIDLMVNTNKLPREEAQTKQTNQTRKPTTKSIQGIEKREWDRNMCQ